MDDIGKQEQIDHGSVGLFRLPREIRDRVYSFALIADTCIDDVLSPRLRRTYLQPSLKHLCSPRRKSQWRRAFNKLGLNLLLCNRQLAREAAALFYGRNVFHFKCFLDWTDLYLFLQRIGTTNRRHLQNVRMYMETPRVRKIGANGRVDVGVVRLQGQEMSFLDAGRPGGLARLPVGSVVDTLPSSLAACFGLLRGAGPAVRVNIICWMWSPVPEFRAEYHLPGRNSSYPDVAETIETCRRDFLAVDDRKGRVEVVWTVTGQLGAVPANRERIERHGWEILGPERGKVDCAEEYSNSFCRSFTVRRKDSSGLARDHGPC